MITSEGEHVTFEEVMTTCEIMRDFRHNKCRKIKFGHFSDLTDPQPSADQGEKRANRTDGKR